MKKITGVFFRFSINEIHHTFFLIVQRLFQKQILRIYYKFDCLQNISYNMDTREKLKRFTENNLEKFKERRQVYAVFQT